MDSKTFSKLIILFIICVVPFVCSKDSKIYPAIFNFGDSNSDTGNYNAALAYPVSPLFGQTYFKKPSGRVCDGRLIIDFLMEAMGFPYLPPYLDSVGGPSFINGTDFAFAGSVIKGVPDGSPFHLKVQTNQFIRFKAKVNEIHAAKSADFNPYIPPNEHFAKALYMFDIGQNDLTLIFYKNPTFQEVLDKLPGIISVEEECITKLYESGARNFWIHNTGPLGCLPEKIVIAGNDSTKFDEVGCVITHNEAAKAFNQLLHALFKKLQGQFSDANFVYVDVFTIKLDLITNYKKYGFEKNLMACCGYGGPPSNFDFSIRCGAAVNVNGTLLISKSCDDSSKYINWDAVHYTEAANRFVASQILTGKYSDPQFSLLTPKPNPDVKETREDL